MKSFLSKAKAQWEQDPFNEEALERYINFLVIYDQKDLDLLDFVLDPRRFRRSLGRRGLGFDFDTWDQPRVIDGIFAIFSQSIVKNPRVGQFFAPYGSELLEVFESRRLGDSGDSAPNRAASALVYNRDAYRFALEDFLRRFRSQDYEHSTSDYHLVKSFNDEDMEAIPLLIEIVETGVPRRFGPTFQKVAFNALTRNCDRSPQAHEYVRRMALTNYEPAGILRLTCHCFDYVDHVCQEPDFEIEYEGYCEACDIDCTCGGEREGEVLTQRPVVWREVADEAFASGGMDAYNEAMRYTTDAMSGRRLDYEDIYEIRARARTSPCISLKEMEEMIKNSTYSCETRWYLLSRYRDRLGENPERIEQFLIYMQETDWNQDCRQYEAEWMRELLREALDSIEEGYDFESGESPWDYED